MVYLISIQLFVVIWFLNKICSNQVKQSNHFKIYFSKFYKKL